MSDEFVPKTKCCRTCRWGVVDAEGPCEYCWAQNKWEAAPNKPKDAQRIRSKP